MKVSRRILAAVVAALVPACGGGATGGKGNGSGTITLDGGVAVDAGFADGIGSNADRLPPGPSPTFEAETMTAVDPRPNSQLAYAVTIESTLQDIAEAPTGKCIVRKRLHVYRSRDLGQNWEEMPGSSDLPAGQGDWTTDPDISVGGDGTLYLTLLLGFAGTNCGTPQNTSTRAIELWFAPPPTPEADPGLTPAFTDGRSAIGTGPGADHPQIVASPAISGQVVVGTGETQFATFQRNADGLYDEVSPRIDAGSFANLAMDEAGRLYVANALPINSTVGVRRFVFSSGRWNEQLPAAAPPPLPADRNRDFFGMQLSSTPVVFFDPEPTPALAVATLPGDTSPTVFVGFEVEDAQQVRQIQIASISGADLSQVRTRLVAVPPGSPKTFHPGLGVDATNGFVDLLTYSLSQPATAPGAPPPALANIRMRTIFHRFNARELTVCLGATRVNADDTTAPRVSDLPARHPKGTAADFGLTSLFDGEYTGVATKDRTAVLAWPELNTSTISVDVGRTGFAPACGQGTCPGSGLTNDPSAHPVCPAPLPPIPGCTSPAVATPTFKRFSVPPTSTFEAGVVTAADPRPSASLVYAATVEATTQPGPGPTGKCITGRRIRMYRSTDQGTNWSLMPGTDNLPQVQWVMDPHLSVGGDGRVYLGFKRTGGAPDCNTDPDFSFGEVQVWSAPAPNGAADPGLAPVVSSISGASPSVAAPLVIASPTRTGQVVVLVRDLANFFVTYQRNGAGTFDEVNRFSSTSQAAAMDGQGNLYTAIPGAERFAWSGTAWVSMNRGFALAGGSSEVPVPSTPAVLFEGSSDPAFVVANLGNTSTPIVFLAYETVGAQDARQIRIDVANSNDLTRWTTRILPIPAGSLASFRPNISVDGPNNILDLVAYDVMGTAGAPLSNLGLRTTFYRLDASRLTVFMGPTAVNVTIPALSDLPSQDSFGVIDTESGPVDLRTILFAGHTVGIATKGLNGFAGWPELNSAAANVDLGLATITGACSDTLNLIDPDAVWQCACNCGLGSQLPALVGCAPGGASTPGAACASVCRGSPCGRSLSCAATACSAGTTGTRLSTNSCAMSDGPPEGASPAGFADYRASATGASSAVIRVGGQAATTAVTGQAFVNLSTSPPLTGAGVEIALLDAHPADVFVGGSVNAFVRNIKVIHRSRLQGVMTDSKHFRIDPRMAEFIVTIQTEASEGGLSAPVNIIGSNASAMTGTFDLGAGTFALDGTATDSAGNALELHFKGTIVARPPDTDHDGIIDAVDKCSGVTSGPDRIPPKFTFVPPALTITKCKNVSIGQATAMDSCGVTITNNAPAVFPAGTTTVIWTAKDNVGNVATAAQEVTAVLGDDVSCCPAGANIIVGTSNNDVLTGTSGVDCILGLGGQDRISGGGGNDFISGGDGDDTIFGDDGNDRIYGGSAQDVISGGNGNDWIDGQDGVDTVKGDAGDDTLLGGQARDQITGGIGNDVLIGGADDDNLFGGDGNDRLVGGTGNDTLNGENGDDVLFGQTGDDHLNGGTGLNTFRGGSGHDLCTNNGVPLSCPLTPR